MEPSLLTITDAAALAGRSVSTLRLWEQQGRLVPLRDSRGRRLYRPDQVRQAAEAGRGVGVTDRNQKPNGAKR